jgi:hypothetical protein
MFFQRRKDLLIGSKGRVLGTLPFLFICFGDHQLADHLNIEDSWVSFKITFSGQTFSDT